MGNHARLGPSNARWPNCPGSVREEERYSDISGEAAIDGTGSHLLLEMCLENNVPAMQYDQQIIGVNHPDNMNGWLVDPARAGRVQMALDYITRRVEELKAAYTDCQVTVESEGKSDPGGAFGRKDWWGTVDISIIARHKMTGEVLFLEIADYKDGRGYVSEKNNTQLISYLFGKMRHYIASGSDLVRPFNHGKINECRVTIIQPKTNPVVRYQCTTRVEDEFTVTGVIEAAEILAQSAQLTDNNNAPLIPGKHCQWCKANPKRGGHCTAETEKSLQVVENMSNKSPLNLSTSDMSLFDYFSEVIADPKSLTEEQLTQMADAEDGIMAVFTKVKAEIQERIEQGVSVPGYAMEPGRGANVYASDEVSIVKKLKACRLKNADIYPPKLISPAQLMKLEQLTDKQKERLQKEIISFKAGKLTLKKVAYDHKAIKEVAYDHKAIKEVAQSGTDDVQSKSAELMFAEVPKQPAEEPAVVSFI